MLARRDEVTWWSWLVAGCGLALGAACTGAQETQPGSPEGGAGVMAGAGGAESSGAAGGAGGSTVAEGGSASGAAGQGGQPGEVPSYPELIERGAVHSSQTARPAFGALLVASDGERAYVVESRRDVEPGPFGLPWRSRFRLAAYDGEREAWAYAAAADDVISDVVVHPSGDVTLSLLRHAPARDAFDLVRLTRAGVELGTTTLSAPLTIPETDYGPADARPLFRRKSVFADAKTAGWLRLLPDAEHVVFSYLSYVDLPSSEPSSIRLALAVGALDWQAGAYVERWTRVVEGPHAAEPAAWAYDELSWRDQAVRPFLTRDALDGDVLVGRGWNHTRCAANVAAFAEFTAADCMTGAVNPIENERIPLAVTRFDAGGARLGTAILRLDDDAAEQVPFALAAHAGQLFVAGSVVRLAEGGQKRTYPDANGYVDYDGYIAVYDAEGERLRHHDFNLGRGDVLSALRWTPGGVVAVGSAGWDRWQGGMSISRGADPLFAWLSLDGAVAAARVVPFDGDSRHFNLHDLLLQEGSLVGYGFSDAPMTHSADGNDTAARTFGALRVSLQAP